MLYCLRDTDGCKIYLSHRSLLAHRSACQPSRRKLSQYNSQVVKLPRRLKISVLSVARATKSSAGNKKKLMESMESLVYGSLNNSFICRRCRQRLALQSAACMHNVIDGIIFLDIKDTHCACEVMRDRGYPGSYFWVSCMKLRLARIIKDKKQSAHHSMLSNKLEQEILLFNPFLLLHNYRGLQSSSPPLMSPDHQESPLGAQFSAQQHLLMNMLIKLGWGTSAEAAADSSEGRGKHSRGTAPR